MINMSIRVGELWYAGNDVSLPTPRHGIFGISLRSKHAVIKQRNTAPHYYNITFTYHPIPAIIRSLDKVDTCMR
jgi:hypothetical protein